MVFDATKHQLVPKHSKLSDKDKEALLGKYHIELKDLPKIFNDDPLAAKLRVKAGDVIKIERQSRTAGTAAYYRLVIDS